MTMMSRWDLRAHAVAVTDCIEQERRRDEVDPTRDASLRNAAYALNNLSASGNDINTQHVWVADDVLASIAGALRTAADSITVPETGHDRVPGKLVATLREVADTIHTPTEAHT